MDAYNFIIPTIDKDSEVYKNRHQITVDEYATFKWRGVDSYETFGCFITNKNDLKWVNYAAYKDEFSNPMFSSSVSYLGTTYQQKSLKLNLGVYWVTDYEYRLFLNWISPDVIGEFEFGYNKKWAYKVKVGSIGESTYYSLGYNEKGETVYYVELNITFITVNNTAVTCTECWDKKTNKRGKEIDVFFLQGKENYTELYTNINYSHRMKLLPGVHYKVSFCQIKDDKKLWSLTDLQTIDEDSALQNQFLLFSFTTNNFTDPNIAVTIQYDSERGNLYINNQLLSDLMLINGISIIKSYQINKFVLPGVLNNTSLAHNIGIDVENFDYGALEYYDMYGEWIDTITIKLNEDLTYSYYSQKNGKQRTSRIVPPKGQRWIYSDNDMLSKVPALNKTIRQYAVPDKRDKDSDITKLDIDLTSIEKPLELYFYAFEANSTISIDWGDGIIDKNIPTNKMQGPFSYSHSYTMTGQYTIKISKNGSIGIGNAFFATGTGYLEDNSFISSDCMTRIVIGKDFKVNQNSLSRLTNLTRVVFTNQEEIVLECFIEDINLEFVNFLYPTKNKIIRGNAFKNTKVSELYLLPSTSLDRDSLANSSISTIFQCDFEAGENLLRVIKKSLDVLESGDYVSPFYIKLEIEEDTNTKISKISDIENTPLISIYPKRQL